MMFFVLHILGMSSSQVTYIFFRGVKPPTSIVLYMYIYIYMYTLCLNILGPYHGSKYLLRKYLGYDFGGWVPSVFVSIGHVYTYIICSNKWFQVIVPGNYVCNMFYLGRKQNKLLLGTEHFRVHSKKAQIAGTKW